MADSRLRVVIDAVDNSKGAMNSASARVKKLSADVGAAGRSFIAIGAPLVALGALSVKTFGTFEQQMARVQAVSNATASEFADLNLVAREMGRTTVFTANQSADALAFMAMAGLSAKNSIGALPSVLQLAAAGGLELGNAADIITNVMAGMRLEVEDLGRANDVLVTAFTSTNTNLQQLGQAFKFAGPVASAAGLTFEETAAALAQMGNAGIQATMAGTALRGAITKLLNPTGEAAKVLERIGVTALDSTGQLLPLVDIVGQFEKVGLQAGDAMTIFGLRAGPGMLALISQGSGALEDLQNKMLDSGGTAKRIADVQLATLQGQFILLKSAVEGAALELGASLMPALRNIIDALRPVVAAVTNFIENNRTLAVVVALVGVALVAVGAVLVGISIIVPGLVTGFGLVTGAATIMWAALTGPVGLTILAIAAVVSAFLIFRDKLPAIFEFVGKAFEFFVNEVLLFHINNTIRGLNLLIGIFTDKVIPTIKVQVADAFRSAGESVEDFADGAVQQLEKLAGGFTGMFKSVEEVSDAFANWATVLSEAADATEMAGRFTTTFITRLGRLATVLSKAAEKQETLNMNTEAYTDAWRDASKAVVQGYRDISAGDIAIRNSINLFDDFGTEILDLAFDAIPAFEDALLKARTGMSDAQVSLVNSKLAAQALEAEIGDLGRALDFMAEEGLSRWTELLLDGTITMDLYIAVWKSLKDQVDETNESMKESIEITGELIDAHIRAVNATLNDPNTGVALPTRTRIGPDGSLQYFIPGFGWITAATVAGGNGGGGIASAAHGGVVQGTGPKLLVAHGGETITPAGQGRGVTVVFSGPVFGFDDFEDRVVEATNRATRRGALDVEP